MKAFVNLIVILVAVTLVSCKKKTYPESVVEGTGVFYFNASIDNTPVSITAGNDNYYMYSSYNQNANNVYCFSADLRSQSCSNNCAKSLQIKINDFKVSAANANVIIDSALAVHPYPILSGSTGYQVQFQSLYNKTALSYLWDFGDGLTSAEVNPVHTYNRIGKYNVSLTINRSGPYYGKITNTIKVGYPAGTCTTSVIEAGKTANIIQFSSNTQGASPVYLWSFGDGNTSALANPTHTYTYAGSYPVLLRVIDTNNDTAFASYNAVTQTDMSSGTTNYSIVSTSTVQNFPTLSNIIISWVDENGTVFTSDNVLQPPSSYFRILAVDNFENNENNERTKKIRVRFKCNVYNGVNYKTIDNAEATICVSYK